MPSLRPLLTPVLVVLGTIALIVGGNRVLFPPGGGYFVTAEFADTGGLTKNSDVKIGGVPGGKVSEIELTARDTAKVTMELDEGAFPLGAGASAASRPVNLLGEKYVDMQAGDLSRPVPSGSTIPIDRTSRPVELDDLLNMLDPDVRARLRILINEAGIGMAGRKADFNAILDQLPPSLDRTGELVRQFNTDNQVLDRLIDRSDRVLASIGREDEDLEQLIDAADGALGTTAARRRELAATVRNAPGALRQLRTTLADLAGTATDLEPAARQLRASAPALTATLRDLPAFARDAAPALAQARATAPALSRLGKEARPVVARLKPTSTELERFATDFAPLVKTFDSHAMRSMLGLMNGWARTIRRSDGLGHVFGLRIIFDRQLVDTVLQRYAGGAGTKKGTKQRKATRPDAAKPVGDRVKDALPKAPKEVLDRVAENVKKGLDDIGKVLDGATDPVKGAVDGATKELPGVGDRLKSRPRSDASRLFDYLVGE